MKAILLAFLLQIEAIGSSDPAMYDMNVLAGVHQRIHVALTQDKEVTLPPRFGLSTASGEQQLRGAVEKFIRDVRASREYNSARTTDARLDLLFADNTKTPAGHDYDDYFAFAELY